MLLAAALVALAVLGDAFVVQQPVMMNPVNTLNPTLTSTTNARCCDDGWMTFRGNCYIFPKSRLAYREAQAFCARYGAHLMTISNTEELTTIMLHAPLNQLTWIGLSTLYTAPNTLMNEVVPAPAPAATGIATPGWAMNNGLDWETLPWINKSPRHGQTTGASCAAFFNPLTEANYYTNFYDCDQVHFFACEKDLNNLNVMPVSQREMGVMQPEVVEPVVVPGAVPVREQQPLYEAPVYQQQQPVYQQQQPVATVQQSVNNVQPVAPVQQPFFGSNFFQNGMNAIVLRNITLTEIAQPIMPPAPVERAIEATTQPVMPQTATIIISNYSRVDIARPVFIEPVPAPVPVVITTPQPPPALETATIVITNLTKIAIARPVIIDKSSMLVQQQQTGVVSQPMAASSMLQQTGVMSQPIASSSVVQQTGVVSQPIAASSMVQQSGVVQQQPLDQQTLDEQWNDGLFTNVQQPQQHYGAVVQPRNANAFYNNGQ